MKKHSSTLFISLRGNHPFCKSDLLFKDPSIRKNHPLFEPLICLHHLFYEHNIQLHTSDFYASYDNVLCEIQVDMSVSVKTVNIGIQLESEAWVQNIFSKRFWANSNYVMTWCNKLYDGKKFIKIYHPTAINFEGVKDKNILFSLICSNRPYKNKLLKGYLVRKKIISFFSKKHQKEFKLYGYDWDKFIFSNRYLNYIFKITHLSKLKKIFTKFFMKEIYFGSLINKKTVIERTKFSFAIENSNAYDNYVTEKIFDVFRYGSVPIYWGPDKLTLIPKNTYINFNDFSSLEELYDFCINLDDYSYNNYLINIRNFLSKDAYIFSPDFFSRTIFDLIKERIFER